MNIDIHQFGLHFSVWEKSHGGLDRKKENQQAESQHPNIPHKQRSFNSQPHDHNENSVPLQNTISLQHPLGSLTSLE